MIPFISSHLIKMAADCSKICHHAPPLLRAFNLSKQPFCLPHNSQDAIFSHRSSVMLTKSPSFPSLSFLPKSPPFSHLPYMSSPVAGITSVEWRDRHTSFLDRVHSHNPIPKMAQSVFAGSFSFNHESSPNSSTVAAVTAEIPPTVRSSSLMQMWREQEAKEGLCPIPRTSAAAIPPPSEAEEPSDSSDAIEESKLLAKEIMGTAPGAALLPAPELSPTPSPTPDTDRTKLHVRGKQELEHFLLKLEEECRREAAALAERHPVSQFPFRGRIQTLIRLRSLRQSAAIMQQQWSQKLKSVIFEAESKKISLRKTQEDESQCDINEVPTEESMTDMEIQLSNSLVYVLTITIDHSDTENNRLLELISTRELIEYSPETFHSQYEDQHDRQSLWDESLDSQKPLDSHMLQALLDEVSSDGTEMFNEEKILVSGEGNWLLQPFTSWRGWWRKE
ncbi:protein neuralized [Dendrobium catenatum]|uniref:Protein neuralized n=1 Tax=Dendrobium catenatum TaxID=906689 RepID=A0A2I0VRV4_9ASPA|nr:protein neuralized [Dendrobium catenatum]